MHQQLVFTINLKNYYSVVLIYGWGFLYLYLELKQTLNIVSQHGLKSSEDRYFLKG